MEQPIEKKTVLKAVLDDYARTQEGFIEGIGKIENEADRAAVNTCFIEFNKRLGRLPMKLLFEVIEDE